MQCSGCGKFVWVVVGSMEKVGLRWGRRKKVELQWGRESKEQADAVSDTKIKWW